MLSTLTEDGLATGRVAPRDMPTLYDDHPSLDAAVFVAVPLFLLAVALLAAYVPARRAARIDPAVALQTE